MNAEYPTRHEQRRNAGGASLESVRIPLDGGSAALLFDSLAQAEEAEDTLS